MLGRKGQGGTRKGANRLFDFPAKIFYKMVKYI
jgi:hypothetical protein